MKKVGFIDYFLDEWHANQYPAWIENASGGGLKVTYAYGKTDAEHGLSNAAWCESKGIELLNSIDSVVEKSDYLIVLSPDNPEFHRELSTLALQSGKPTYVDKTFAPDRDTALCLFEVADQHNTPMYSSSALRFADEYTRLQRQGISTICSMGPGTYENYSIHQIEPIVSLMGTDIEKVMFVGTSASPALIIAFADGRQATIRHFDNSPFSMAVSYDSGEFAQIKVESDFFAEFIRQMVSFFDTGKPPVDPSETIAIVTIIEYGILARQTPYQWVKLPR